MEFTWEELEGLIGHRFEDRALLQRALRHRSAGSPNYERLEFLGDAVLSFVVSDELFKGFPCENEHGLTRKRSVLTDRTYLIEVAKDLHLEPYMEVGASVKGKVTEGMVADAVEALIGAIYLDGGMEAVRGFIYDRMAPPTAMEQAFHRIDHISKVKEWCDRHRLPSPLYTTLEVKDGNSQYFQAWLRLPDRSTNGQGRTKRDAKAQAAERMLEHLRD
jgi:ribonuclease-3